MDILREKRSSMIKHDIGTDREELRRKVIRENRELSGKKETFKFAYIKKVGSPRRRPQRPRNHFFGGGFGFRL